MSSESSRRDVRLDLAQLDLLDPPVLSETTAAAARLLRARHHHG